MPKFPGGALLTGFYIDRSSHVPIYRQIDTELRRLILEGALAAKQKLPSTRELAMELGVSRITLNRFMSNSSQKAMRRLRQVREPSFPKVWILKLRQKLRFLKKILG